MESISSSHVSRAERHQAGRCRSALSVSEAAPLLAGSVHAWMTASGPGNPRARAGLLQAHPVFQMDQRRGSPEQMFASSTLLTRAGVRAAYTGQRRESNRNRFCCPPSRRSFFPVPGSERPPLPMPLLSLPQPRTGFPQSGEDLVDFYLGSKRSLNRWDTAQK